MPVQRACKKLFWEFLFFFLPFPGVRQSLPPIQWQTSTVGVHLVAYLTTFWNGGCCHFHFLCCKCRRRAETRLGILVHRWQWHALAMQHATKEMMVSQISNKWRYRNVYLKKSNTRAQNNTPHTIIVWNTKNSCNMAASHCQTSRIQLMASAPALRVPIHVSSNNNWGAI